ncbi:MAG: hypothetical protein HDQ99_02770 [Lachnospiraceae bacterium]|nr:hypothetical protein [Lachnospiraceae bacterium]
MVETQFIDDRTLRDNSVGHYEVLEKVKKLLLIPSFEVMTLKQVADYYEVDPHTVEMICSRNADELDSDGVCRKKVKDFLNSQHVRTEKSSYTTTFIYDNGLIITMSNGGLKVFPRRAILRVGMLLRDSEIAKEVRTQLLNIEEKTSDEIKTHDIDEEQSLMLSVGMAVASGDATAVAVASAKLVEFKNRHIQKLEKDNKALAEGILEWCDRNKLNAGIRQLASVTGIHFSKMWNELYKNLQYKYGICVKQRGGTPYIQWINESEWDDVMKTFCAMCEAYGQSPSEMLQQTTPVGNLKKAN